MDTPTGYIQDEETRTEDDGSITDLIAKDHDFNELHSKLGAVKATGDVDLSAYCTPSNQFNSSSCVGNATADSVEILNAIAGYNPVQLSRLFVYAMARIRSGDKDLDKDSGTFIRTAFDCLARFGVCDEYLWPFDTSKIGDKPSTKAQRQAVGHRIHSYYRIKAKGDDRLQLIIDALHADHPVVFGTLITRDFQGISDRTPFDCPDKADSIGGHAMICVGYVGGSFVIKNSWGKNWGSKGFCLITPEYMSWANTWDLWVPTLGVEFD